VKHMTNPVKGSELERGVRAGIPIALGYIPLAITFGVLARASGLGVGIAAMMSVVIYSGASQFLTVGLVTAGAPPISILVTNLVLNLRHVILSTSLARRYPLNKRLPAAVVSFGITDETFVVASNEKSARLSTGFLLGLNATAYLSWIAGTMAGAIFAGWIPADWSSSLGVALYAMFIALLVPDMTKSAQVSAVAVVAALLSWALHDVLGSGWSVVAATLLAALVGTMLDRKRVNPS